MRLHDADVASGRDPLPAQGIDDPRRDTLLGCLAIALFADWDGERSTALAFRAVPVAFACYAVAAVIKRQLRPSGALILFVIGGGFWLAAASLQLMTG